MLKSFQLCGWNMKKVMLFVTEVRMDFKKYFEGEKTTQKKSTQTRLLSVFTLQSVQEML